MIQDLKPYPAYRDSGVPWLGQVPEHWDAKRLSQLGRLSKGNGGTREDEVPTGVPCVRYGDLYTTHTFFILRARSYVRPERAINYTPIKYGDILFAASGETIDDIGKSAVNLMEEPAVCGGDVILLRPTARVEPRFMGYTSDCRAAAVQKASMGRGFTVKHIYSNHLKFLILPLPSLPEQSAIVRFLDHVDRRIRRYIRAKQQLIKLLEEQKQAIIHRAVTRGLDPNVRLKSSGVGWLGDVPEHWELVRSKRLFSARKDLALLEDVQLSATQAYGVIPQSDFEAKVGRRVVKISMHLEKRRHVEVDDFVISMRSFQGGLERAWSSGAIRSSYVVLKPESGVDVGFFAYLFKSYGYIRALQATADFIRDGQDLNFGNFCRVDLPLIPFAEQRAIAAFIDKSTVVIDKSYSRVESEISLLREYRIRLIADVVTGKLDVREAAAALPEEPEELEPPGNTDVLAADDGAGESTDLESVLEGVEV